MILRPGIASGLFFAVLLTPGKRNMPFSLTDHQLALVMAAAGPLAPEKRVVLMERVAASLKRQDLRRPSDAEIERALRSALSRGCFLRPREARWSDARCKAAPQT